MTLFVLYLNTSFNLRIFCLHWGLDPIFIGKDLCGVNVNVNDMFMTLALGLALKRGLLQDHIQKTVTFFVKRSTFHSIDGVKFDWIRIYQVRKSAVCLRT